MALQTIPVASLGPSSYPSPLGTAGGRGRPRRPAAVQAIDPNSIPRSLPATGDDRLLRGQLARRAAAAAMAGETDRIVGNLNGALALVPIPLAAATTRRVDVEGALWWSAVLAATGQPRRFGD